MSLNGLWWGLPENKILFSPTKGKYNGLSHSTSPLPNSKGDVTLFFNYQSKAGIRA